MFTVAIAWTHAIMRHEYSMYGAVCGLILCRFSSFFLSNTVSLIYVLLTEFHCHASIWGQSPCQLEVYKFCDNAMAE